jgi:two-component system response regulator HydG
VLVIGERLLQTSAARAGKQITGFTPAAEELLLSYRWPGNVRELRNAVDYAVAVARYTVIGEEDLPDTVRPAQPTMDPADQELRWKTLEQRHIETVLRSVGGNRSRAAKQLGIDRKTLQRKLERAGVHIPPQRSQTRATAPAENANANANGTSEAQPSPYRFNLR